jgi:hypothetical protein
MRNVTKREIVKSVSSGLIEFGYPDAKPPMITAILDAYLAGKRGSDLPHGVVGRFAERQFEQLEEAGLDLAKATA